MRNTILAKRYAKALFMVGKEENAYEDYAQVLNEMSALYKSNPEVVDALTNPMYPLDVRCKCMEGIVKSIKTSGPMGNFLNLLVHKKRADVLPDIAEVFQIMVDEEQGICRGSVITASVLSDKLKNKIQDKLEKVAGKKVIVTTRVDPSIIGGVIAKVGDLVLDGSIKSQLASLKESIKGSE